MKLNKINVLVISKDNWYITEFNGTAEEAKLYFLGYQNNTLGGKCIAVVVFPNEMENPQMQICSYLGVYMQFGMVPFLTYVAEIWGRTAIALQIQDNELRNEVNHLLWVLDGVAETWNQDYLKFKNEFLQIPQD